MAGMSPIIRGHLSSLELIEISQGTREDLSVTQHVSNQAMSAHNMLLEQHGDSILARCHEGVLPVAKRMHSIHSKTS